jgi:hypothetical protein
MTEANPTRVSDSAALAARWPDGLIAKRDAAIAEFDLALAERALALNVLQAICAALSAGLEKWPGRSWPASRPQ